MIPLILFHAKCADGAGAAWAAWNLFGDEAEYRPALHGDPVPTNNEVRRRDVYVLDFSYPMDELRRMAAVASKVVVIDHHKTAFERALNEASPDQVLACDLSERSLVFSGTQLRIMIDLDHSGAVLAWRHFHQAPVPDILLYIQDRDLWQWNLTDSKAVSAAIEAAGVRADFRKLHGLLIYELVRDGGAILRSQEQYVDAIVDGAEIVRLKNSPPGLWSDSTLFFAANTPILQSEVGALLAEMSRLKGNAPVGAAWFWDGSRGTYRVSLRSVAGFDVTAIAKAHSGGGHPASAGFECKELPWKRI